MKTLRRIVHTPLTDLLLLAEAAVLLPASWIALKCFPMARLVDWLRAPAARSAPANPAEVAERVRWAILAVARRSPVEFVCFPQSLAAFLLLRRRGVPSVIHYGVARSPEQKLHAHTWLQSGDFIVVGGEAARDFTLIRSFP